ncbi:hypothetical protein M409DRAFT_22460 [Zasmidium cellare ATCC 36951]|uniref:DNA-directed RNA polymerase III subunit n=1 Tax=Zasmidium cellare ATCC 36951 TaxID=1080233 RepID=A0A6A6CJ07_ZASCE|nr:uncharacterized protein M409DRAFT_22460 [Zasmidium cellare ATCC 36951]KAF2167021.1 hypothetical protein M409DRAFT_22460 [Zasmidium cellare ATCC 36951]
MSRGGRGGGGAGRMGGRDLPFEVDAALEEQMAAYRGYADDDDWTKTLYPPTEVYKYIPGIAHEKRLVSKWREHRSAMRNGPLFIDVATTGKRDLAEFNAFEDIATYSSKKAKRAGGLPNLKKVPIVKDLLPRELWDVVSDGEEGGDNPDATKKNLAFLKKRKLDKLAQFDEGADGDAAADAKDADDEVNEADQEGEDGVEELQDDDYEEDEDDLGNDYNGEQYFDNGDDADDDGDDGGANEDAWKEKEQREEQRRRERKCELKSRRDYDITHERITWDRHAQVIEGCEYISGYLNRRLQNAARDEAEVEEEEAERRSVRARADETRRYGRADVAKKKVRLHGSR